MPVTLAVALAVRAPRLGHVFVDLATIAQTATVESEEPVDLSALPWPAAGDWVQAVRSSTLVAPGPGPSRRRGRGRRQGRGRGRRASAPLRLEGSRLYLDRYWREERRVAAGPRTLQRCRRPRRRRAGPRRRSRAPVHRRLRRAPAGGCGGRGASGASRSSAAGPAPGRRRPSRGSSRCSPSRPRTAGAPAARRACGADREGGGPAAEAVHDEAATLDRARRPAALLLGLRGSTLHRLLGWRPGSHSRFAHDRENRLPHDVVIVDETSMVSLSLMARLVEAVRPDARLILVGDPGQLTSIEAGRCPRRHRRPRGVAAADQPCRTGAADGGDRRRDSGRGSAHRRDDR